jgi:hypothetical protein
MCLFNGEVSSVANTKIFVSPLVSKTDKAANGKQITVYSNAVSAAGVHDKTTFAMVLPFPVPAKLKDAVPSSVSHLITANVDVIQLLNLKDFEIRHGKFFDVVNKPFPVYASRSMNSFSLSDSYSYSKPLQVVKVGDYQVSVARTLPDLKRIDTSVFKLTSNMDQVLEKCYGEGFGFVICAFDPSKPVDTNSQSSHPIAYVSHTLPDGCLFVPTRHEHGQGHHTEEHWDHSIYSFNTAKLSDMRVQESAVKTDPFSSSQRTMLNGLLGSSILPATKEHRKLSIQGMYKNEDLALKVAA